MCVCLCVCWIGFYLSYFFQKKKTGLIQVINSLSEMIKPYGRQFYLFIQYQLFACSVSGTYLRWPERGQLGKNRKKKEKEKFQLFIDSLKSFPQGFFLPKLLLRFLVPVSDSVVTVPRDLRAWHVCLMILTVLIASVCVRARVRVRACARTRVFKGAGTTGSVVNKYSRSN